MALTISPSWSVPLVKTASGPVTGVATDGVAAFLGIPYAAPPVGPLRWRPPQPVATWTAPRVANQFGTSCVQQQPGSRLPWTEEFMTQGPVGEDCLFLNVWAPQGKTDARLPVMVWIYGGGFTEGSSSVAVYDGAALARMGVVLVSLNYRVGSLGFLAHPELTKESPEKSSGNYGLLDQIAALRWVQANIAAFGGDPKRVTIFGQSAGAISVTSLMRSPLAKGLFAGAIAQSGPGLLGRNALGGMQTLADREAAGVKYATSLGAPSLAELRALPPTALLAQGAPRGPFNDGWVLGATDPVEQVPVTIGFVADDLAISGSLAPPSKPTLENYKADAEKAYGADAAAFLALYPALSDDEVPAARKSAGRDRGRVAIELWAANQRKASPRVYTYYFDRVLPWPQHPEFGAFHTSEVPYIFRTLDKLDRPWTAVDRIVSETVASYWTGFARSGDPNGNGLAPWPAYTSDGHTTMQLGERMGAMPVADPPKREFFVRQLTRQ